MNRIIAVCLSLSFLSALGWTEQATTSSLAGVYEIHGTTVTIPSYDSKIEPFKPETKFYPSDFAPPALVYNERVIYEIGEIRTHPIDVPSTASEFFIYARALPEANVFPRIHIAFKSDASETTISLFTGHVQSRPTDYLRVSLPPEARGKHGQIIFNFLNPSNLNDRRSLHIAFIGFR